MATIHFSQTYEYKIINPEPSLFIVCFRSKNSKTGAWSILIEKNSFEEAVAVVNRNITTDDKKEQIINEEGIDFELDLKPEPEPDAAI